MVGNLEQLVVKIQADVSGLQTSISRAERSVKGFGNLATTTGKIAAGAFASIGFSMANMAGSALASIPRIADSMTMLKSRLEIATGSAAGAEAAFSKIRAISGATGQSIDNLAALFNRLSLANQTLQLSQDELLRTTETFAKTLVISGTSTAEASSATLQFSQALASGVLRGEELNALLESNSYFAIQLAESLGVPIGELRKMGEQGLLTSDIIVQAMRDMQAEVDATAAKIPQTLGRQMTILQNDFAVFADKMNETLGLIPRLITLIQSLTEAVSFLGKALNIAKSSFADIAALGDSGSLDRMTLARIGVVPNNAPQQNQSFPVLPPSLQGFAGFSEMPANLPAISGAAKPKPPKLKPAGGSDPLKKERDAIADYLRDFNQQLAALDNQILTFGKAEAEIEKVNKQQELMNMLQDENIKLTDSQRDAFNGMLQDYTDRIDKLDELKKAEEAAKDAAQRNKQAMQELGATFSSAFEDAIVKGGNLRDVMQGLYQDIARIITRKAITEPLAGAAEGLLKGIDFGSIFGGLFGRAGGGQVRAGQAYMVGESGREMFIPESNGRIMTAGQTRNMGGASPTIYQSFNIQTGIEGVARAEILKAAPALMEQAKQATLSAIRRGGSAAQTVGLRA